MQSGLAKVLHQLAGRPLLQYVIAAAVGVKVKQLAVVIGHQADLVQQTFCNLPITWATQERQAGTADAAACGLAQLQPTDRILVLSGDVPLIQASTLARLIDHTASDAVGLLTVHTQDPSGFGRIVRDAENKICKIVEEKDATTAERAINEINAGIYIFPAAKLSGWLAQVGRQNQQNELYLTDVIAFAANDGVAIHGEKVAHIEEVLGVNTRSQLAVLERSYQRLQAEKLMQQGATIIDPMRIDIRGEVTVEQDVTIDVNVVLEGKIHLAKNSYIGPNVHIKDSSIGPGSQILSHSVLDSASVGVNCQVGPFARLRPGAVLQEQVKVGNFVEVKN